MSEQKPSRPRGADPERMGRSMAEIAERSQRLVRDFLERQASGEAAPDYQVLDPGVVSRSFQALWAQMLEDPRRLIEAQAKLWQDYAALWQSAARRMLGEDPEPVAEIDPKDRRFADEAWRANVVFDYLKQSYLLAAGYLQDTVRQTEGLDPHTAEKVDFYTRQLTDAMAPTNFAMTNPEVIQRTVETGGENLLEGLANVLEDLERGRGQLRIKMTDLEQFELGVNVATAPGAVVYQNELMQLIQYAPSTETVYKRPLLIVPPWINKYYILDLRPKNSFIRWAVAEGLTVFVISWVNPDERLAARTFEDYMHEGPLAALEAIERSTGESTVNAIGYCIGGTLLAATLAWLEAKGRRPVSSATFFTTMVDFSEPGELGVFIDDEQLSLMEAEMQRKGYFEGAKMADAFNLLRANDLIWSFVVNNYLLGRDPFPFDLLYWNSDSTRMPREMHRFYLRRMYQHNLLREPGGIELSGVKIDLRRIGLPVYILSTKEDHIAPWRSVYAATRLYAGEKRFVLGMSGHIAGVMNPPAAKKYGYWTNDALPDAPEDWLAGATAHEGSWWVDWKRWVAQRAGQKVAARVPGEGGPVVIEAAPGSYVKQRIE